jgi:hypothetical protein
MPGAILRSNADEQPDDTTVVWTVAAGERRTLEVASERPWSLARLVLVLGGPYGAAAVLAGVLGIAGAVGYRWRRRRATLGATEPAAGDPGVDEPATAEAGAGPASTGGSRTDASDEPAGGEPDAGSGVGSASTGGSRTDATDGAGDDAGAEQHGPDRDAPGAASAAGDGPGAAPAAGDGAGDVHAGGAGAGAVPDDPDDDDPGDGAATIRPSRVRP